MSGVCVGIAHGVELATTRLAKTSVIEGEIFDRDSARSSLQRQFGLKADNRHVSPAESGLLN